MNIIVNGGTRGIGKEVVLLLAKDKGNRILVTGRSESTLKRLQSGAKNKNISVCTTDLSVFDKHQKAFLKSVSSEMKSVDILINTAGSVIVRDFMSFSNEQAREIMETNFFGPASVIRVLRPLMKKGSHIVNISSMGGYQGSSKYRGLSYYSASKAAISCLSECLAVEFRDTGIAVNCLALGSVQTEMFEEAFPGYKADVSAKEMARFIVDFALNGNKFFNGKVLPVAVSNP
ncbi:MAG: SDR family oxidoreductase [Bacteroidales bacterium]|jgi:NAD(P)-dependent dehydrogenase (short-subunit alcohol dehydrogenase family)|nr:SDR family oxidoreductase [Bacteroidales bacterium]